MTGIALKRTFFSSTREFLEAIIFADQYHNFIFLDYEGLKHLINPDQLETLIEKIRHFLVFTIAVRSSEFHFQRKYLLENYLRLARKNPNLLFCVVAGHPVYPSVNTELPSFNAFHNIFTRIRNRSSSVVFLGVENLTSRFVRGLSQKYKPVIPFLLHGDPRAVHSNRISPPLAVYTPLAHSIPEEEAIKPLLGYLLRRKATQQALRKKGYCCLTPPMTNNCWTNLLPDIKTILQFNFQKFVLTSQNFHSRTNAFIQNGTKLIVGNPALPNHFFELVKSFKLNKNKDPIELDSNFTVLGQKRSDSSSELIRSV